MNTLRLKRAKSLMLFGLIIFLFSSCEDIIELDLQDADTKLVIEANVSDQMEHQYVKISKTIPFNSSNTFNGFKGAQVRLSSAGGTTITFAEVSDGVYKSPQFRGIPGQTYKMEVLADGKLYSAESTMPIRVSADSISFKTLSFFGDKRIYPVIYYKDPVNIQNQYRYILKINNKYQSDIVFEDRFNDGNAVSDVIIYDGDEIKSGDTIDVEMQSIDRKVFKYYFAISQIEGNGGPPVAPANPNSNWNNGALGIFSAHSKSNISIIYK